MFRLPAFLSLVLVLLYCSIWCLGQMAHKCSSLQSLDHLDKNWLIDNPNVTLSSVQLK